MFAGVIVDIANSAVDRSFTYRVPEGLSCRTGQHVLVPFGRGNTPKEGFVVELTDTCELDSVKELLRIIDETPVFSAEQLETARWMSRAYHCLFIDALRLMIPAQLRGERIHEKRVKTVLAEPGAATAIDSLRSPRQRELLSLLVDSGLEMTLSDLTSLVEGAASAVTALEKKGLVSTNSRGIYRRPQGFSELAAKPVLTDEQQAAAEKIGAAMDCGGKTLLLYGVTGSGKTEVYLRAIERCLERGQGAIALVPEIALTPQTIARFSSRFGDSVAVLHSRLSAGERYDEWRRIREGRARIVVGARSAVFAPVKNLGLIVVDEEHEGSYQSEKVPRYSADEVAAYRMKQTGGTLILGSATPRLISYYRALSGRYELVPLTRRVLSRPLPRVELIDMGEELRNGNNNIISQRLTKVLAECFSAGHSAMLFINRRGYSSFVACRSCGEALKCDDCDVSLTYHKSQNRALCHYCGATKPLPKLCPNCGKPFIKHHGIGTEQVEEAIGKLFPSVRSVRMDTDTVAAKGSHSRILAEFASGRAQLLIGTQMIAKGHDFPNVTVVGIIAADGTLNLPDFRSGERTFQLLTQVAGRAGRDEAPGRVVLQTFKPTHPIIQFAKAQDYVGFYQYELAERRKLLYPPFSVFVRILLSGEEEGELDKQGVEYAQKLESELRRSLGIEGKNDLLLLAADFAPINRIAGRYRYQILVKLLRTKRLATALDAIYRFHEGACGAGVAAVEVNPREMY